MVKGMARNSFEYFGCGSGDFHELEYSSQIYYFYKNTKPPKL